MKPVVACNIKQLPVRLRGKPHWVDWKLEAVDGRPKPAKMPYDPKTGQKAKANDVKTWASFPEAVAALGQGYDGVGWFAFRSAGIVLIDLDHCIADGTIAPWAQAILDRFPGTYAERSQSGEGIHLIAYAPRVPFGEPGERDGGKKGDVEIYGGRHYLALTGDRLSDDRADVAATDFTEEVTALGVETGILDAAHIPAETAKAAAAEPAKPGSAPAHIPTGADALTDEAVLAALGRGPKGARLLALYHDGDEQRNQGKDSENDYAMIAALCEITADDEQVKRLLLASPLKRKKWGERRGGGTWLEYSIGNARRSSSHAIAAELVPAVSAQDLRKKGLPPPPAAVVPGLAWEGRVTMLAAREGLGKSTLFAEAANAVATGTGFLGSEPVTRGPVLWVLVEEHISDWLRRADEVAGPDVALDNLHVLEYPTDRLNDLKREVARLAPRLVVIDTLHAFAAPDVEHGSQADDWQTIMHVLGTIAHAPGGPAILLAAQASKSTGDYRDSTAIGHGVDVSMTLRDFDGRGGDKITREALVKKSRLRIGNLIYQLQGAKEVDGALIGGRLVRVGKDATPKAKAKAAVSAELDDAIVAHVRARPRVGVTAIRDAVPGRSTEITAALKRLTSGKDARLQRAADGTYTVVEDV